MRIVKRFFAFAVIFALAAGSFAYAEDREAKEAELLFMANKAYEDGFYEVSLGMLERLQKEFPDSEKKRDVRLLTAQCYFYQARYLEALDILERLLKDRAAKGLRDAIYFWIGEVHFKGENYGKASDFYELVIGDFPRSFYAPQAYYSLGWSFFLSGKYKESAEAFDTLQQKFPKEPQSKDAAFKVIECLYYLKEYDKLKERVQPCFKLYADDALRLSYLYFYLAESDYYLGDFEGARANYLRSFQSTADEGVTNLAQLGLAWSYLKLKKYKEAEESFARVKTSILDNKSLDILLLGRATLMLQTNRVYESRKIYEQLIGSTNDPLVSAQAYLGKAEALYNLAEYSAAGQVYKEGLEKIDKDKVPGKVIDKLSYKLALSYLKQGNLGAAKGEIDKLAGSWTERDLTVEVLSQLGDAYQDSGEFGKAINIYSLILKNYGDSTHGDYAQYQLAASYLKNNDYEAAISAFKLLEKDYPRSELLDDAAYSLGLVYFKKEDYLAASQELNRFKNEFRDSNLAGQVFYLQGLCLLNLGKINEALPVFNDILRLNPEDSELLQKAEYEIADCYYKLGKNKEALERFKLLRSRYPDSRFASRVLWWLGRYYYRSGDLDLAVRYFNSLVSDFPESELTVDAYYALGLIFGEEGKLVTAADNLKMAQKLAKGAMKSRVLAGLGGIYLREGEFKEAKSAYSKSLEEAAAQDSAGIHFGLAEALEGCSESEAAIREYRRAADLSDENTQLFISALLRAAKLYEDVEDFKSALKIYTRVSQKGGPEAGFARERIEWINSRFPKKQLTYP